MGVTFNFNEFFMSARTVVGNTLHELGQTHDNVWCLTADTGGALKGYIKDCSDRFVDVGIAEQNVVGIAAGLALEGNIPFVMGMIPFMTMRSCEQIRTSVCYQDLPVRFIGTGGGLTSGGGSTHNAMEDIAIMKSMVNMTVLNWRSKHGPGYSAFEHELPASIIYPPCPGQERPRALSTRYH
jgi:transketolase